MKSFSVLATLALFGSQAAAAAIDNAPRDVESADQADSPAYYFYFSKRGVETPEVARREVADSDEVESPAYYFYFSKRGEEGPQVARRDTEETESPAYYFYFS
ncbi:hypothetical protein GGR53DRAFT_495495 [Hypoxylon sp. FL1150]|nr:hypothetical protein GGR53DRAFT_495495 [Hypoxylon sp. FL1150]